MRSWTRRSASRHQSGPTHPVRLRSLQVHDQTRGTQFVSPLCRPFVGQRPFKTCQGLSFVTFRLPSSFSAGTFHHAEGRRQGVRTSFAMVACFGFPRKCATAASSRRIHREFLHGRTGRRASPDIADVFHVCRKERRSPTVVNGSGHAQGNDKVVQPSQGIRLYPVRGRLQGHARPHERCQKVRPDGVERWTGSGIRTRAWMERQDGCRELQSGRMTSSCSIRWNGLQAPGTSGSASRSPRPKARLAAGLTSSPVPRGVSPHLRVMPA